MMRLKHKTTFLTILGLLLSFSPAFSQKLPSSISDEVWERKADSVMKLMTLEEKVGQLHQVSSSKNLTGPGGLKVPMEDEIKAGRLGSILNVGGAVETRRVQKVAVEQSRMKIPLLFGLDVIHGYKTLFPIPLAEAASFDLALMEKSARIAAIEASATGIHWTFAPMVDIARDPRWGRIAEGAGEDTYLGCRAAEARVKGFQGKDLADNNTILACVKHFAGYGFAEEGKDYNTITISERVMRETVLPPFQAAAKVGAATFMNAFNDYNGVPASGNKFLVQDLLKKEWGFRGFVVSDWNSIGEMKSWGTAKDNQDAAMQAINVGSDMDMMGYCYINNLVNLVRTGKVEESKINESVKRILKVKFMLGLFADPFKYCNEKREKALLFHPDHIAASRDAARKSMVLLKNDQNLLPLAKTTKNILLVGKLSDAGDEMLGCWKGGCSHIKDTYTCSGVSIVQGLKNRLGDKASMQYVPTEAIRTCTEVEIQSAVEAAAKAEVILVAVGEKGEEGGEGNSYTDINLSESNIALLKALSATGKPIVLNVIASRPLILTKALPFVQSILYVWHTGAEAGNAYADLLFGDYSPSAKMPVTMPYSQGQIPIYYNMKNTGRPIWADTAKTVKQRYASGFNDAPSLPLYPFGHGLSYGKFAYSDLTLSKKEIFINEVLEVKVSITNTGKMDAVETPQLYIRDLVASVTKPLKELKGFQKVAIKAGETKEVVFTLSHEDLKLWNRDMQFVAEPGDFEVFVGTSSRETKKAGFVLK